jgi:hypothetical protein
MSKFICMKLEGLISSIEWIKRPVKCFYRLQKYDLFKCLSIK